VLLNNLCYAHSFDPVTTLWVQDIPKSSSLPQSTTQEVQDKRRVLEIIVAEAFLQVSAFEVAQTLAFSRSSLFHSTITFLPVLHSPVPLLPNIREPFDPLDPRGSVPRINHLGGRLSYEAYR
jgi:hypothetical protein